MSTPASETVWVLADDRPGNVAQAVGVAEALGLPFAVKTIRYNAWGALHNLLRASSRRGLLLWSRKAIEQTPPPSLVIAAGRRTAPLARWFKRRFDSRLVQIMDPGWPGRDSFDLIAAPLHDDLPDAPNVIHTLGSCHRASPAILSAEAARWRDRLPVAARPWTLVAVGGDTVHFRFGAKEAGRLAGQVRNLSGSVLVVTSRRTGAAALAELRACLPDAAGFWTWREEEDSPYLALLGLADQIVVTGDSMSMCSEACANGGGVFIFAPDGATDPKHARLHALLYGRFYARPLGADPAPWRHPPLNAALSVVEEIRSRGFI